MCESVFERHMTRCSRGVEGARFPVRTPNHKTRVEMSILQLTGMQVKKCEILLIAARGQRD